MVNKANRYVKEAFTYASDCLAATVPERIKTPYWINVAHKIITSEVGRTKKTSPYKIGALKNVCLAHISNESYGW